MQRRLGFRGYRTWYRPRREFLAMPPGERFVQHMPAVRAALPTGDFRNWPAIDAWAAQIAAELGPGELRGE